MKTAHCKHNILKSHFDITWRHLENACLHFSVDRLLIEELKAIFYSVESDIVKVKPEVTPLALEIKNEQSKASECPFKAKMTLLSSVDDDENNPTKLSHNSYMKWQY